MQPLKKKKMREKNHAISQNCIERFSVSRLQDFYLPTVDKGYELTMHLGNHFGRKEV